MPEGRARTSHPVEALERVTHEFGPDAARRKGRLLESLGPLARLSPRRLVRLHDVLYFLRAYPDDRAVLEAVRARIPELRAAVEQHTHEDPVHPGFLDTGLPGSVNAHGFSYEVLRRLVELHPGALEIDWEADFDSTPLAEALVLTLARSEMRGLEDAYVDLPEWLEHSRAHPAETDLEVVLRLVGGSTLLPEHQKHVYETCGVPVLYSLSRAGQGRCEIGLAPRRPTFCRKPIERETFALPPRIVRPPERRRRLAPAAGRRMLDISLEALCNRNLEIFPLTCANPADVTLVDCGRGLQVMLSGTLSRFRETPETLLFFLILKNGVPIAYGPASVFLGCCDMGMNLFPEFRGGEVRFFYTQLMRSLYHLAGVRYFFVPAYGMGEDNPEALNSGAFWFYRKLGFSATQPEIEQLARAEEKKRRRDPRYRCPMPMLRRLSHTAAHLDLSGGRCVPTHFARLALAVSRHITATYGGDRRRAQRLGGRRLAQALGAQDSASWSPDERTALEQLGPFFGMIPELERWPARERRTLLRAIRARGASDDMAYARATATQRRLVEAVQAITNSGPFPPSP